MRIVGQPHCIVKHVLIRTGPNRRAIASHLEGVRLTLKMAQAVVVESC